MITVTPNLKRDYPRAFELARQDRFRIVWLEPDLAYCARRGDGHGQYLIRFFVVPTVSGDQQVKMRCTSTTGGRCKWTEFHEDEPCAHIAAVLLRGIEKLNKRERQSHERSAA